MQATPETVCENCKMMGHWEQTCLRGYVVMPDVDAGQTAVMMELRCEKCGSVNHSGYKCEQNLGTIPKPIQHQALATCANCG